MNIIRRMMKITRNIHCGGAQTNINRLRFEEKISPDDVLKRAGYDVNDTLRMYKNDDIRMYNFNCITDTIVEVITTCNTYTLLTVHLL
jgi:hypothetical protein